MKLLTIVIVGWLATNLHFPAASRIIITRSSTDKEVVAAEERSLKELGFQSEISVIERNSKGQIIKLSCEVYGKSGGKGVCASDDFGALEIKSNGGCAIADNGKEKRLLAGR